MRSSWGQAVLGRGRRTTPGAAGVLSSSTSLSVRNFAAQQDDFFIDAYGYMNTTDIAPAIQVFAGVTQSVTGWADWFQSNNLLNPPEVVASNKIRLPVTVLWGKRHTDSGDNFLVPENAENLASYVDNVLDVRVWEHLGRNMHLEDPELVAEVIHEIVVLEQNHDMISLLRGDAQQGKKSGVTEGVQQGRRSAPPEVQRSSQFEQNAGGAVQQPASEALLMAGNPPAGAAGPRVVPLDHGSRGRQKRTELLKKNVIRSKAPELELRRVYNAEVPYQMNYPAKHLPQVLRGVFWMDQYGTHSAGVQEHHSWFFPDAAPEMLTSFGGLSGWNATERSLEIPFTASSAQTGPFWTFNDEGNGTNALFEYGFRVRKSIAVLNLPQDDSCDPPLSFEESRDNSTVGPCTVNISFCYDAGSFGLSGYTRRGKTAGPRAPALSGVSTLAGGRGDCAARHPGYVSVPPFRMTATPYGWIREQNFGLDGGPARLQSYPVFRILTEDGRKTEHFNAYLRYANEHRPDGMCRFLRAKGGKIISPHQCSVNVPTVPETSLVLALKRDSRGRAEETRSAEATFQRWHQMSAFIAVAGVAAVVMIGILFRVGRQKYDVSPANVRLVSSKV